MNNRKDNFFHVVALGYHVISKEVKNQIFNTMAFLDTQICINNPYLQSRVLTFLCKYNIVILDTQISSWMCFSKCLL